MKNKKWYTMSASEDGKTAEILIYDEIGYFGVTAKDFRAELKDLGAVEDINLRMNSPGGSVIDGFAIYNTLKNHPAKITSHIDGWAASMASIIAMAGDEVVMPSNTWMVIHNPWTVALGDADDLRKSANILDAMKSDAINAYQSHAKDLSSDDISAHMDEERWMNGADAVALGYADTLADELEIAASISVASDRFKNAPAEAMTWVMSTNGHEEEIEDVPTEDDKPSPEEAPDVPESVAKDVEPEPEPEAETKEDESAEPQGKKLEDWAQSEIYKNGLAVGQAEQLIEQNKMRREFEDQVETLQATIKDNEILVDEMKSRLSRLLPGMSAIDAESCPDTFKEAIALCDGDYAIARKKYPQLYAIQREIDAKNRVLV